VYNAVEEVVDAQPEQLLTLTIHIIMHNGKRVRAVFKRSDTVQHLRDYIASHTQQKDAVFAMWGGRPRALLSHMDQPLLSGNLVQFPVHQRVPNAVLQAAVRCAVARARYLQRLEAEASVMKLSATESRLRRLTEDMRNHSAIMDEHHAREIVEEERQQRLREITEQTAAGRQHSGRRNSRISSIQSPKRCGTTVSGDSRQADDDFSDWDVASGCSDVDCETSAAASAEGTPAETLAPRMKQSPLSAAALQRLHAQVAGLDLLSPLRRRLNAKLRAESGKGTAAPQSLVSASSFRRVDRSADPSPPRVSQGSLSARHMIVSDAERLKRMWNEQRLAAQRAALRPNDQKSLAPDVTPLAVPPSTADCAHPVTAAATSGRLQAAAGAAQPQIAPSLVSRFSYRASLEQQSGGRRCGLRQRTEALG
jgi:hypothetical protein